MTSICGFGAMLLSGFPGLAQLGLFSIAGLLVALSVTRWVLPALLPQGFTARAGALAPRVMSAVQRAPALRYPALLAVAAAAIVLATHRAAIWSDDLASLSPIPKSATDLDGALRRDIGAPDVRHLVVVTAADQQTALEQAEQTGVRLDEAVRHGSLASFDTPATYLPSRATQRRRLAALPAPEALRANLQQALQGLAVSRGPLRAFHRRRATRPQRAAARARQPRRHRARAESRFPAGEAQRRLGGDPAASGCQRRGRNRRVRSRSRTGAVSCCSTSKQATDELFQTYRKEATRHSLAGGAAIVLLLFIALHSPRRVLAVLAPLAAAVIVTFGLLVLSRRRAVDFPPGRAAAGRRSGLELRAILRALCDARHA